MEWIPDEAVVVRGGRNEPGDILRATATHPSGVTGISVECGVGQSIEQLAVSLPHGRVGVTSVAAIRAHGGDVVRTSGRSPHHATLAGLDPHVASALLKPTIPNPAKLKQP